MNKNFRSWVIFVEKRLKVRHTAAQKGTSSAICLVGGCKKLINIHQSFFSGRFTVIPMSKECLSASFTSPSARISSRVNAFE